jgi:hypothetical protein
LVKKQERGIVMKTMMGRRTARRLLLLAPLTAVLAASLTEPAAAHRGGSWMLPADVQVKVEARGFELAICKGRGTYRIPRNAPPDRRYFLFRHFECWVNAGGGAVKCVHTRPGRRIVMVSLPAGSTCRF